MTTDRLTALACLTLACAATLVAASVANTTQPAPDKPTEAVADDLIRAQGHHEVREDPYVPVSRDQMPTSPGGRYVRGRYVSVQANVDANGNNIVGDAANEPSIAVDPNDHNRMVIGWRQFNTVTNNFRQAGWAYTQDGGQSWTFPGVIQPGVFRSDPVVDVNADGVFFYNSLTTDDVDYWCHVFRSYDGGMTWDAGTYAFGGDKQWQVIDTTDGVGRNNIYANWNSFYSICSGSFTRSYNGGSSFVDCTSIPGSPYWGTLAVNAEGDLYVSGTGFTMVKSTTMKYSGQAAQWAFSRTVSLDGSMVMSAGPNPAGLLGQNWIVVDQSDGPTHGYVYMACSVDRNSNPDPLDVMFARSTDGGQTWSAPIRINDDPGTSAWQWFGTMSIAPNGRIDIVWADTRNDPGGYDSELYYSYSTNGGVSFSANEVITPAFDPQVGWPQQNKLGDYYDMTSDDMGADLAYAATFNGGQDVYYLRIGEPWCVDAGAVTLDSPTYACQDTVTILVSDCGLNTDDQTIEYVVVDIDSDSETGVEQVTLTETGAATARFSGSITVSTTNAPAVLWVAPGDTITATYIDADDGQGNYNVVVTDTAVVDCTPPI
ncbi:MAG TPA: sialidase family protein, partial [Phycisphaerae bacterium]|nr:sialidase family protein [Phycisphaerae bacterium]HNU44427.1 sialidase family protein [Phycisphaerae bacterium]